MSFKSPELLIRPKRDYMSKRSHLQQTKKNVAPNSYQEMLTGSHSSVIQFNNISSDPSILFHFGHV